MAAQRDDARGGHDAALARMSAVESEELRERVEELEQRIRDAAGLLLRAQARLLPDTTAHDLVMEGIQALKTGDIEDLG